MKKKVRKFLSLMLTLSMLLGSMGSVVVPKADAANEPQQTTILERGATWSYLVDGTNLDGEDWQTASSAYDTSGWPTGMAPIGYAAPGSEAYGMLSTVLTRPSDGSYPTTYYKTTVEIPDGTDLEHATISGSHLIDAGLFLYVNGTLVYTYNVDEDAAGYENWSSETVRTNVYTDNADEDGAGYENGSIETPVWTDFTIPADKVAAFTTGTNVITAVLKNRGSESPASLIAIELALSVEEQGELVGRAVEPSASADISNLTLQPGSDGSKMNFCWYSALETTECSVQIAEKADMTGEEFPVEAASFASFAGTVSAASDGKNPSTHNSNKVAVTGLSPATEYVYRVGDGTSFSEIYSFATKDPSGGYDAILVGDPQIGSSGNELGDTEGWANTVEQALDSFSDASFILSAGDQVEDWDSETQYDGFFSPSELRSVPLVPTIGNHDNGVLYKYHYNSPNESDAYGTTSAGGDYWFTYGNTLYMVINSNNRTSLSHDAFIGQAIDANPNVKWKVVMFHHSIYSSASHSDDGDILERRSGLYPVFDKYDIDVVLMGHDHSYTRSYQMLGGEAQTEQDYDTEGRVVNPTGTLYITANSGSGSKYYDFLNCDTDYMAVRWQGYSPSYSHLQVTDDTFSITTYDVADMGEPIDTYTIYKGDSPGEIATNYTYLTAALDAEIGTDHDSPVYVLRESDYTADSWSAYSAAIAAGILVEANPDATQAEVDAAKLAITVAKAALVLRNSGDITPYFITLQPGADETQMNFSWATDSGDGTCYVQIARTADMVDEFTFPETAQTVSGDAFPVASDIYSNKAVVTGLAASTEYAYRVGYGNHYSKVNTFTTGDGESYSALLVGDPQIGASGSLINDAAGWSNTVTKMLQNFGGASFILSAGDQVDTKDSEEQYLGFFAPPALANMPLAPTIGNHDNHMLYRFVYNAPNVSSQYGLTDAGGDYWFTYGNTLYMVLNSNNTNAATHDSFMAEAIDANPDVKWKIVMFHHSIYSSASHSTESSIVGFRDAMYPVLDQYDIDVVLMGHDHSYTRSYQMLDGEAQMVQTVDGMGRVVNPTGTLYITANSASGSKYYDLKDVPETYAAVRQQLRTPTYSSIQVTGDTFTISTYRVDNDQMVDTYAIYKGEEAQPDYESKDITLQPGADESKLNFCWYSDVDTTASCVQIARKADMAGYVFPASHESFTGTVTASPGANPAAFNSNEVTVTGLLPATEYVYRVGDGTNFGNVYSFKTHDPSDGYSAIFVGDPQIGSSGSIPNDTAGWTGTVNKSLSRFGDVSFILSAGDQVEHAANETEYDGFFSPAKLANMPLVPTIGNHDDGSLYQYHYNSPHESTTYGTTSAGGDYWFTYGNTLYMVINSNNMTALSHDAFIGAAIAANPDVKWKVVMFHHSIYSSASHSTDGDILGRRESLYPVFDKYDIDVVLMGHDHSYTRSYQMLGGEAQKNQTVDPAGRVVNPTGTLYITANSGSGSKYYDFKNVDTAYMATRWQGYTPSYSNIVVTDDSFTITTYVTETDEQIDTYTIYKGEVSGIASATLAADGDTLTTDPSDTIALSLSAKDGMGGDVNLSGSDIVYKTSPEGILSVDSDGVVTLQSAPAVDKEVKIWAEVTLDGVTVASNQVSVYLAVGVIDLRVRQALDDMEEWIADGNMDYDSSDLEIGWESPTSGDKEEQLVGVRFSDLKIPQGATITGAYIQFTVDEPDKSTNPFDIKIYAEDTADAGAFANVRYNISSRTKTGDYVTWNNCPLWTVEHESNANERTPDISSLLQQIVDKDEWSVGNAVAFILSGTGNRTAEAYDGEPAMAPVLHVSYTLDDEEITRVVAARDELSGEIGSGRYTYASAEAAQDVVDMVNAALADGISDEEETQLLAAISDAMDHLVRINQASLTVSENTILGSDRSITFRIVVDQLQGVDVMEGTLRVTDDRFAITDIESLYEGDNFVFTKNLDYREDGTTAYFSLAQVGGFDDTAKMNVVDVTVTLKDGETATSLETVLDMVRMYIGSLENHTASEVYSDVVGDGTAETRIWIPGDVTCDLNGDGTVNGADLSIAMTYFGAKESDADWYTSGAWRVDLDKGEGGEGVIDIGDLTIIAWIAAGSPETN